MRMADTRIERLHHAPRLPETVVAARVPKVLAAATRLAPRGRGTSDPAAPPAATSPPPPRPPPRPREGGCGSRRPPLRSPRPPGVRLRRRQNRLGARSPHLLA